MQFGDNSFKVNACPKGSVYRRLFRFRVDRREAQFWPYIGATLAAVIKSLDRPTWGFRDVHGV